MSKYRKNDKGHVSLHTLDVAPHTQVLARCPKLNNLKGSSLVSVVLLLQYWRNRTQRFEENPNLLWLDVMAHCLARTASNCVFIVIMLIVETSNCLAVKTVWSYLQLFCHNTLAARQTDDSQTISFDESGTLQYNCNIPVKLLSVFPTVCLQVW